MGCPWSHARDGHGKLLETAPPKIGPCHGTIEEDMFPEPRSGARHRNELGDVNSAGESILLLIYQCGWGATGSHIQKMDNNNGELILPLVE